MTATHFNIRMTDKEREEFTALVLSAVEFGFKFAEKGHNLEMAKKVALENLKFKER